MALLKPHELDIAKAFSELAFCNPFLPERIECEERILGRGHRRNQPVWSAQANPDANHKALERLQAKAEELVDAMRMRAVEEGVGTTKQEQQLYDDLGVYVLYYRYQARFREIIDTGRESDSANRPRKYPFFSEFRADVAEILDSFPDRKPLSPGDAAHLFACYFQTRRAFSYIFRCILGGSMATARLRAAVWQSIFTHDMRRYRSHLYDRLGDMSVLVTGPSGTGKELVARAIGLSRYIPFDPDTGAFAAEWDTTFHPLNLSALSPTLIESELFGHSRGAFTGADREHAGWFEMCGPYGTVFLDEIGEITEPIQVKLLRVLEDRSFARLGETAPRRFEGKILAATNRDLSAAMAAGTFRTDLYYRLCADIIHTPSLCEQVQDNTQELENLVRHLCRRIAGPDEAPQLCREVIAWIRENLDPGYLWPGNVRELEQCVRNILIRKSYTPAAVDMRADDNPFAGLREGTLTAEELLARYCAYVYDRCGSYEETGRRLKLDRRTVKSKVLAVSRLLHEE